MAAISHQSDYRDSLDLEEVPYQLTTMESEDLHRVKERGLQCEEVEKVIIGSDEDRFFKLRPNYPLLKEELLRFLRENIDVFAWSAYEAPGVNLNFKCHHLNVNLAVMPKRKPPRRSSKKHAEVVKEEVNKLK